MRKIWFVAFCALLIFTTSAESQTIRSPFRHVETKYSIGLFGGYLDAQTGSLELAAEAAPLFGGRFGMRLSGPFTFVVVGALSPTQRTAYLRPNPTLPALAAVGEADVMMLDAQAGFVFHLTGPRTWRSLAPFLVGTAGMTMDLVRDDPIEELIPLDQRYRIGPAFAATAGAGLDFFVNERLSIRLEARDHIWRFTYPATLSSTGGKMSEWLHSPSISLGTAIHF